VKEKAMAKRLTVFYSWQSDSPQALNRSFIEEALLEALKRLNADATLEKALRDTPVELDKDIQGVAGSPPIADTILRKIENCAVFVADLSFVGDSKSGFTNKSGKPRQFPNPNVLIEYGYALRCHSHTKLISVMNTAQGSPDAESIPFDLRHLLWPISYHLADSSAPDKSNQFEKLVVALVKAISLILANHSSPMVVIEKFAPQKPTKNAAVFFENVDELFGDRVSKYTFPEGGKMYLRLYPSVIVPQINSELEARTIAINGNLQPLGRVDGCGFDRNIFGAIVYQTPQDGKLCHFTQLFLSRELWGIDAIILNADYLHQRQKEWGQQPLSWIANGYVEEYFVKALHNYLMFSQTHLQLPPPLQVEAGLTGIMGYPISGENNGFYGKSLRDVVQWKSEIPAYGKPAWEILGSFFDRIWANCGIQRTSQDHAALVKKFGG
jgi:hypothetical protein